MTQNYWQCILFPKVSTLTAYPPEWQIHGEEDFEGFNPDPDAEEEGLGMALLAKVDQKGHLTDTFKCCIFGTGPTMFTVSAEEIFVKPPEPISKMWFKVSATSEMMSPPPKKTCTPWKDFADSIIDGMVIATDVQGNIIDSKPVLDYLAEKTPGGYSTRWAVGGNLSTVPTSLQMEFHVLPAPVKMLKEKKLEEDHCPSVQTHCIPLRVKLFDGEVAAGPVPILFAANREAAVRGLQNNVDATLEEIKSLNSRFLVMNTKTKENALHYIKSNPKLTMRNVKKAFPLPKHSERGKFLI
jgi:hypothetical protein